MKSIWDKKCYEPVSWDEIGQEGSTHYIHPVGDTALVLNQKKEKIAKKAIIGGGIVGTSLALFEVIYPLFGVVSAAISAGILIYDSINEQERRRIEEVYNELFPIKGRGYIGVGEREPWMNSAEKLSLYDIGSTGHIVEGIAHGFSLFRAKPKEVKDIKIDLKDNLYMAGGPIPNAYSRNVLYGKAIQTPYKFRFDLNEKLANRSPTDLKRVSYKTEPNWSICDESGRDYGTPKIEDGKFIEDYFMIIKCKNIYPQARKNAKSVIFAGCHGPGTSAAGALIKNKDLLNYIYTEVGNDDFQLIGRVSIERKLYEHGIVEKHTDFTKNNIIDIQLI